MHKKPIHLTIYSNYGSERKWYEEDVTIETVKEKLENLDWNEFHQVQLSRGLSNWIEGGGNIREDGLGCIYEEDGDFFVTEEAPNSIE